MSLRSCYLSLFRKGRLFLLFILFLSLSNKTNVYYHTKLLKIIPLILSYVIPIAFEQTCKGDSRHNNA